MTMRVSIIVPCYNYGWLLAETLDSLVAQIYQQWECLIVDDGSTDDTKQVAETYQARDSRFRYIYRDNGGLSAARNTGIEQATGEYIQFLDSDDFIVPGKLEAQVALLEKRPEVDIVYGGVRFFRHGEPTILSTTQNFPPTHTSWMLPLMGRGKQVVGLLVTFNQLVVNAPLVRKTLIQEVGFFDESLRSLEDWQYWLRCALHGAFFEYQDTPDTWAIVRTHGGSMSQNRPRMLLFEQQVRIWLAESLQAANLPEAQAINQRRLDELPRENAINDIRHGDLKRGLLTYWQLARTTGQYVPLAREAFYCLRHRKVPAVVK